MTVDGGEFDVIVVGAGSAGAVAASRLAERGDLKVLVLEAGGMDRHPGFRLPLLMGAFIKSGIYNWNFDTEPEPQLAGRRIPWPRGRVAGGTSTLNGMVYIRGLRSDFDGWAQMGLTGWSWDDVLPYFRKSEGHLQRRDGLHGTEGPLTVTRARGNNPLTAAFIAAGGEAGYPINDDFNGPSQEGFGRYDFTIRDGKRCGTARAFLRPAMRLQNLTLRLNVVVTRIVVENGRAVGVAYRAGGRELVARARGEIVVSAGAIGSPQILMLSGIGPAAHLREHGIDVVADRPGVGQSLQDHFDCSLVYAATKRVSLYRDLRLDRLAISLLRGMAFGTGPATVFPYEGGAFIRTEPGEGDPDVQIHFMHGREDTASPHLLDSGPAEERHGFTIRVSPLRPESRGDIRLRSADPLAKPLIRANYLASDYDIRLTLAGLRQMRRVAEQPALTPYRGRELSPGADTRSDADFRAWLGRIGGTTFHPSGTCAMGIDERAVVDARLKVHGVAGLRVADASIMPRVTSGNTNAPSIMIGERVADFVKEDLRS
ncbi:choline dehydrogenase [Kaistia dalseonensis]|uniref:Choline dehydrogenase n=1 Tax=Kaistia dalseonensis TaxID=410840 RepID=A0ABU0H7B7_9HYPH|nr:choline dehydrogenase [Kaistia dalseonensis]MCX5495607.1 choline dehydrogenase [Kaistia dalseonensis]MDQ0438200.1 choline dehydrogenase [Kaistia dalseonensis]